MLGHLKNPNRAKGMKGKKWEMNNGRAETNQILKPFLFSTRPTYVQRCLKSGHLPSYQSEY